MKYIVEYQPNANAYNPFIVLATFRTWNRSFGRYQTQAQANRRARDLSRKAS